MRRPRYTFQSTTCSKDEKPAYPNYSQIEYKKLQAPFVLVKGANAERIALNEQVYSLTSVDGAPKRPLHAKEREARLCHTFSLQLPVMLL